MPVKMPVIQTKKVSGSECACASLRGSEECHGNLQSCLIEPQLQPAATMTKCWKLLVAGRLEER
jgi:hypothetical protein